MLPCNKAKESVSVLANNNMAPCSIAGMDITLRWEDAIAAQGMDAGIPVQVIVHTSAKQRVSGWWEGN